jgi:cystathionine beta-lyase
VADEKPSKTDTLAVHAGRMSREHFGVVNTPVYRASTILYPDLAALESRDMPYTYGRRGTPTSCSFEDAITALEGGARTLLPSGLGAITFAILSVCRAGDHLLMVDTCYGPTRSFCDKMLARLGIETTYYDPASAAASPALFRRTRAPSSARARARSPSKCRTYRRSRPLAHARGASF